jgi:hypothetical protein
MGWKWGNPFRKTPAPQPVHIEIVRRHEDPEWNYDAVAATGDGMIFGPTWLKTQGQAREAAKDAYPGVKIIDGWKWGG